MNYVANAERYISTATGSVASQSYTYDDAPAALQDNGFELAGYAFTGWNTQPDGKGKQYEAGSSVNFAEAFHVDATLYATWKPDTNGKKYTLKRVKTVNANVLNHTVTGLKKDLYYRAVVRAFRMVNDKKVYIAASPTIHAVSGGGNDKYTNAKSITLNVSKVSLKVGGSKQLKATVKGLKSDKKVLSKGHTALVRYYSSNKAVATVNASGRIRAVGKGTCMIYALTPNGVCKKVKVTVK